MRAVDGGDAPGLGALVIGQSPRPELAAEILALAGGRVRLDLRGALDGLDRDGLRRLRPVDAADVLFTRLPDGTGLRVSKRAVVRHGLARLEALEEAGCDAVVVLCTGSFPEWAGRKGVLFASLALAGMVRGCLPRGRRLGVFAPLPEQCDAARRRWERLGYPTAVQALSPNAGDRAAAAAAGRLARHRPDLYVFDCISYLRRTKRAVQARVRAPAVLAVSSAVRTALELID